MRDETENPCLSEENLLLSQTFTKPAEFVRKAEKGKHCDNLNNFECALLITKIKVNSQSGKKKKLKSTFGGTKQYRIWIFFF